MNRNHHVKDSSVFPLAVLLIAMISVQAGAALAKQLFPLVGPLGTSSLRLGIAALILSMIWRPWTRFPKGKAFFWICSYGAALGSMNFFFYLAIAKIPLGITVAIEFLGPLAIALLSSRKVSDFLWALLAAMGILLLMPFSNFSQPLNPTGILFAFLAACSWGLYIFFGQRAGPLAEDGVVTSLGMIVAAAFVVPIGAFSSAKPLVSLSLLPMAIGVAVFSSALPYSLEMIALKRIPAKKFGILMSLEPAIATLSGLLFLDEFLSVTQWLAISFIVLASLGTTLATEDTKKALAYEV